MPRFLLVVRDASGKTREATFNAASEAEVEAAARRKGYSVVRVEQIHDVEDNADPEPAPDAPPTRRPGRAADGLTSLTRFLPFVSLGLAGFAVFLSLATLGYVIWSDPLGAGLGRYDFTDPRAAYLSSMQMEKKGDLRAALEYRRRFGDRTPAARRLIEKIDTYEFRKEIEYGSRKGLLITYKSGGERRHELAWFEKDERTGWWVESEIKLTDIEKQDSELAEQLRRFLTTGEVQLSKK
jgi:hypothetical protein